MRRCLDCGLPMPPRDFIVENDPPMKNLMCEPCYQDMRTIIGVELQEVDTAIKHASLKIAAMTFLFWIAIVVARVYG